LKVKFTEQNSGKKDHSVDIERTDFKKTQKQQQPKTLYLPFLKAESKNTPA